MNLNNYDNYNDVEISCHKENQQLLSSYNSVWIGIAEYRILCRKIGTKNNEIKVVNRNMYIYLLCPNYLQSFVKLYCADFGGV